MMFVEITGDSGTGKSFLADWIKNNFSPAHGSKIMVMDEMWGLPTVAAVGAWMRDNPNGVVVAVGNKRRKDAKELYKAAVRSADNLRLTASGGTTPNINITLSRAEPPKVEPPAITITLTTQAPEPSSHTKKLEDQYQASLFARKVVDFLNSNIDKTIVIAANGAVVFQPSEACVVRLKSSSNRVSVVENALLKSVGMYMDEPEGDKQAWQAMNTKRVRMLDLLRQEGYVVDHGKVNLMAGSDFSLGASWCWTFDLDKLS